MSKELVNTGLSLAGTALSTAATTPATLGTTAATIANLTGGGGAMIATKTAIIGIALTPAALVGVGIGAIIGIGIWASCKK